MELPGEVTGPRIGTTILGLGSNQGDRVRNLEHALGHLSRHVELDRISSIYESEPVEVRDQPWFLNLVCIGITRLKPHPLLEFLHEIETAMGREPGPRYGPRPIDIDILAYEDRVISEADLEIPHPRLTERRFVLEPLTEIDPEWRHPVEGRTAGELLSELNGALVRVYAMPPSAAEPPPIT